MVYFMFITLLPSYVAPMYLYVTNVFDNHITCVLPYVSVCTCLLFICYLYVLVYYFYVLVWCFSHDRSL